MFSCHDDWHLAVKCVCARQMHEDALQKGAHLKTKFSLTSVQFLKSNKEHH